MHYYCLHTYRCYSLIAALFHPQHSLPCNVRGMPLCISYLVILFNLIMSACRTKAAYQISDSGYPILIPASALFLDPTHPYCHRRNPARHTLHRQNCTSESNTLSMTCWHSQEFLKCACQRPRQNLGWLQDTFLYANPSRPTLGRSHQTLTRHPE